MAALDPAAMSAALKEYYDESKLVDLTANESPFLNQLPRGKFIGNGVPVPMITDPGQGSLSGRYTVANTNRMPADLKRFFLQKHGRLYAIGEIDRDVIQLAETPKGAFEGITAETNAKLKFVAKELAHTLFRGENGVCGTVSTITANAPSAGLTTIVVSDPADVQNLGPGAELVASATPAGALRGGGAAYTVVSVVQATGTIVVTGTPIATSAWAVGDSLHREGNAPAGGDVVVPLGLGDWIVGAGVSSTPFRGVDRSVNPDRLAGVSLAIGSMSVREAISRLAAHLFVNGGNPDTLWVHPLRFTELEMELDSAAVHEKVIPRGVSAEVRAMIGYNAIRIAAGNGSIRIMSDPFCPYTRAYMITTSTWKFLDLGGVRMPSLVDMGRHGLLNMENADAVKYQVEAKGELMCNNPGANGVLTF